MTVNMTNLVRASLEVARMADPYPALTGWADFATGYAANLLRCTEIDMRAYALATLDEYQFAAIVVRDVRAYERDRAKWTDPEADAIGRDFQRAANDLLPAENVEAPF